MAHKTDEVESTSETGKPGEKKPVSKTKFTLLISLLVAIIILLSVIIILLMSFNVSNNNRNMSNNDTDEQSDDSNDDINEFQSSATQPQLPGSTYKLIYRDRWGGRAPLYERPQELPVKYVIISHTAGAQCLNITSCSKQMVQIQTMHVHSGSPDIGYNFLIGGDANIYVARGWDNHNFHMNLETIGISFLGNYMYNVLTPEMIEATHQLLKMGVETGKLNLDYILVAHNQTYSTVSPGLNVYKQIKFWPHFSSGILTDID